jgi:hypothetical protein
MVTRKHCDVRAATMIRTTAAGTPPRRGRMQMLKLLRLTVLAGLMVLFGAG